MSNKDANLGNINHIAKDIVFNGKINFQKNLNISGLVIGSIDSEDGNICVTKKGEVNGNINIVSIENNGIISGSIKAKVVNIKNPSQCNASITTEELMIERFAKISGSINMPE